MRSKTVIMSVVICVVALLVTWEYGHAASAPGANPLKIGVVSIRTVFNKTQHQIEFRTQAIARRRRAQTQLEDLAKEIQAKEEELQTLKQGTPDHLQQLQSVMDQRGKLESRKEFLNQQSAMENKLWTEKLYQETLKIVSALAKERGLDFVLERTEPTFPISSEELMATLGTHKVLYASAGTDLTAEVVKRLDAIPSLQP
ncbi:MAG: OmpH/Skp family outer membrane protein [Planctomycetota bacterium]|jgi:Skp family chaperone for outer membrane proteins